MKIIILANLFLITSCVSMENQAEKEYLSHRRKACPEEQHVNCNIKSGNDELSYYTSEKKIVNIPFNKRVDTIPEESFDVEYIDSASEEYEEME